MCAFARPPGGDREQVHAEALRTDRLLCYALDRAEALLAGVGCGRGGRFGMSLVWNWTLNGLLKLNRHSVRNLAVGSRRRYRRTDKKGGCGNNQSQVGYAHVNRLYPADGASYHHVRARPYLVPRMALGSCHRRLGILLQPH